MKESGVAWIGEVPEGWKLERNKYLFNFTKELVGVAHSSVQLLSLTTVGVKKRNREDCSGKVPESYETYQYVSCDDLVMCLFDLDCSAVFSGLSAYQGMISPAYKILKCKAGVYPSFYQYWFEFVFVGRKYMTYAKNVRYSIGIDEFGALSSVCPPYQEQKLIAAYLDAQCGKIEALRGKLEKEIERLGEYKKSVITESVTKGLKPGRKMKHSGVAWIGEVPEEWKVARQRYLVKITTGNKDTQDADPYGEYPFYVRSPIVERSAEYTFDGVGILMAGDGAGAGRVFHLADGKYAVHQRVYRLFEFLTDPKFHWYYLSHTFPYEMDRGSAQSTVPSVRLPMLLNHQFVVPPLSEQREIVAYLDKKCGAIDAAVAKCRRQMDLLTEYRKSLIYECVTGKKEVA